MMLGGWVDSSSSEEKDAMRDATERERKKKKTKTENKDTNVVEVNFLLLLL